MRFQNDVVPGHFTDEVRQHLAEALALVLQGCLKMDIHGLRKFRLTIPKPDQCEIPMRVGTVRSKVSSFIFVRYHLECRALKSKCSLGEFSKAKTTKCRPMEEGK
ncbi:hypothetical protein AVEN_175258-1 [Araneus ventricosus]|uniref:Uncharacterized protein n=1 Tax=Araneus ventricosus TaxID=182803 RepID=A0A4Y2EY38_ARAVE|nr:hypothetical protein AVEN_175258-1 [Araneus ventricosus]